jgi:hypothetical protein
VTAMVLFRNFRWKNRARSLSVKPAHTSKVLASVKKLTCSSFSVRSCFFVARSRSFAESRLAGLTPSLQMCYTELYETPKVFAIRLYAKYLYEVGVGSVHLNLRSKVASFSSVRCCRVYFKIPLTIVINFAL